MSINAHRIIEVKLAESPSFKLWTNSKFMNFLEEKADFYETLNSNGSGESEVPVKILKQAVRMAAKLEIDVDTLKQIKLDIAFATANDNDTVVYDCF